MASSSTATSADIEVAHLTPDSDSDSDSDGGADDDAADSDLDLDVGGKEGGRSGRESYKMQTRHLVGKHKEKHKEKIIAAESSGEALVLHTMQSDMHEDEDIREDVYRDESGGRRSSFSTVHSYQLYTPDEERTVVRKFDRKLVLFVALLYMLSFLDRSSMFFDPLYYPLLLIPCLSMLKD
ncbi:hypothetical protein NHQ30_002522 [Ciborinia camelliae]|nr:hypothetical protein NHQ30_002522 [Ciborinia camelliae]